MKKYLITGIGGFVGQYFVDCLRRHEPDSNIVGVDIIPQTRIPNIKYFQLNLTDKDAVYQILKNEKPNYIIHLAAISSVAQSWQDPAGCFINNMTAFLNLADGVRELNLPIRLLCVGSSEEYGFYDEVLREDLALHPKSPYSVAKLSQEYLSKLYVDRFGLDIVMTRSFNHIGPGQSTRFVIPSFIKQLVDIANGNQENKMSVGNIDVVRDFLDVRDVVEAYYQIVQKGKTRQVYNVCSGNGIKLRDIIETAAAQIGITPKIEIDPARVRTNEMMMVVGDNTKLCQELGWESHYSLQQTILDIIKDIESQNGPKN